MTSSRCLNKLTFANLIQYHIFYIFKACSAVHKSQTQLKMIAISVVSEDQDIEVELIPHVQFIGVQHTVTLREANSDNGEFFFYFF